MLIVADALDCLTSISTWFSSFHLVESNPFTRYADGHFWLMHSLVVKSLGWLEYLFIAYALYWVVKKYSPKVADLVAAAPILYEFYVVIDNGVFSNLVNMTGWYTPLVHHALVFLGK